mmetsp:Transcript_5033/g.12878  ORF Transcript_5033/g.12878 Transcript_5033/m.12878 type:complete len:323 (+) Transcript_5033:1035-2003(+)
MACTSVPVSASSRRPVASIGNPMSANSCPTRSSKSMLPSASRVMCPWWVISFTFGASSRHGSFSQAQPDTDKLSMSPAGEITRRTRRESSASAGVSTSSGAIFRVVAVAIGLPLLPTRRPSSTCMSADATRSGFAISSAPALRRATSRPSPETMRSALAVRTGSPLVRETSTSSALTSASFVRETTAKDSATLATTTNSASDTAAQVTHRWLRAFSSLPTRSSRACEISVSLRVPEPSTSYLPTARRTILLMGSSAKPAGEVVSAAGFTGELSGEGAEADPVRAWATAAGSLEGGSMATFTEPKPHAGCLGEFYRGGTASRG